MVEKASIRLSSVWARASSAPPNIDSSAMAIQTGACSLKIHGEASRNAASSPKVAMSTTDTISAVVIGAAADGHGRKPEVKGDQAELQGKADDHQADDEAFDRRSRPAPPPPIKASAISVQAIAGQDRVRGTARAAAAASGVPCDQTSATAASSARSRQIVPIQELADQLARDDERNDRTAQAPTSRGRPAGRETA